MKRILFITIIFFGTTALSQSLSQQFGAVSTQIEFTTSNSPMVVTQQQIVKRAGAIFSDVSEKSYGAGYETFRLEIEVQEDLPLLRSRLFDGNGSFQMNFYSISGEHLGFVRFRSTEVDRIRKDIIFNSPVQFYSFDLINVPLILLDKTNRIDIERYIW